MSSSTRRPFGVSLVSLFLLVSGVLQIGMGIVFLVQRNDDDLLEAADATSGDVTTIGIVAIVSGVIALLVGSALRGGARWARNLIGIIAIANVAVLVWAAVSYHHVHWYNVAWPAVLYSLLAGYLFGDEDAKAYFA